MNAPPWVVDVAFTRPDGARRHLWLPVFLLWPLVAIAALLALVVTVLVDAAMRASGNLRWRSTDALGAVVEVLLNARGLQVSVERPGTSIDLTIK